MHRKKAALRRVPAADLRLQPAQRLCAKFDPHSIARFQTASAEQMGFRVLDNCAEEHIM